MNSTLITPEELTEIKKLLKQADEAIINNVYAKSKIKEALNKLKNRIMKLTIEVINGKWTVNGKLLHELSPNEKNALDQFIKSVDYEVKH